MKKLLAICLTIVMLMSFSVIAFAAPDNFVSSPSGQSAPEIIDFSVESEDCYADLIITPYSERDDLPEEIREQFEKAYEQIVSATDLTAFSSAGVYARRACCTLFPSCARISSGMSLGD